MDLHPNDIIRLALLMTEASLSGKIIFGLIDKRSFMSYLPIERKVAWLCIFFFCASTGIQHIVHFDNPINWYALPFTVIALTLGWISVRKVRIPVKVPDYPPCGDDIPDRNHPARVARVPTKPIRNKG